MKKMLRKGSLWRTLLVTAVVFLILMSLSLSILGSMEKASLDGQTDQVRRAVRNALITCYAVEGRYPSELSYLEENYGLAFNEDRYFVYYDAFASNILPDVIVTVRGSEEL